jgi:putative hydrolase of the HAD superfamily
VGIRHLIFDLDHTLWDFEKNAEEAIEHVLKIHAAQLPKQLNFSAFFAVFSPINQKLWEQLDRGQISHEYLRRQRFKLSLEALDISISEDLSFELNLSFLDLLPNKAHLMPGALNMLRQVQGKYGLHILSNGYLTIQEKKMRSAGIWHFFQAIICSDSTGFRKPDPEIFQHLLTQIGASAKDCLMLGDNYLADIGGASGAGMKAIHYDPLGQHIHPDRISQWEDLADLLKNF